MSLVTIAEIQALGADGGLSTAELQAIIDREEAELIRLFGPHYTGTPISETARGKGPSIYLKRQIGSVASVSEYAYLGDTAPVALAAADYYVWSEEGRIQRVTAARWGAVTTVSYTPVDDTNLRKAVLIELVRLTSNQDIAGGSVAGLSFSISAASQSSGASPFDAQRVAQYARLGWLDR